MYERRRLVIYFRKKLEVGDVDGLKQSSFGSVFEFVSENGQSSSDNISSEFISMWAEMHLKLWVGQGAAGGCVYAWEPAIYGYAHKAEKVPQIRTLKTLPEIRLLSNQSSRLAKKS